MDPAQSLIFTPTRAKRNSKAPERFSSDDIKVEASSNNDTLGSGKHSERSSKKSSSSSATNKLQAREPLKVKLPKLKRPQATPPLQIKVKISRNSNGSSNVNTSVGPSIGKIKLPIRRPKGDSTCPDKRATSPETSSAMSEGSQATLASASASSKGDLKLTLPTKNLDDNHDEPDAAQASRSAKSNSDIVDNETSMDEDMDSSFSSDGTNSSAMQIIVERKPEQSDSGIRCPCGVDDDLGVMVECENCSTWQHGHCINVGMEEDAYEGYVCGYCSHPPGKHHDSLQQLTVGDKFQSKFEALEALLRKRNKDNEDKAESFDENQGSFSQSELEHVVRDLRRVFTSLRVKWKLLTNEDYSPELRIWRNFIWSDKMEENQRHQQQQAISFIGDVCKGNLRLNICNMLNRMHRRCQLIRYQISRLEGAQSTLESKQTFDSLLTTLDDISRVVEDYSEKLRQS